MRWFAFTIFFFLPTLLFSQDVFDYGYPLITNYLPSDYNAHAQVWCAEQDEAGLYFFGCGDGLLTFDGNRWQTTRLPNRSTVRSMTYHNDTLFIGAIKELGYFTKNAQGSLHYVSLQAHLPQQYQDFGDVWQVTYKNNRVIYRTNKHLFVWHTREQEFKVFTSKDYYKIIEENDTLYINSWQTGLLKYDLDQDSLILIEETRNFFRSDLIYGFVKSRIPWTIMGKYGFHKFDGQHFTMLKTNARLSAKRTFNFSKTGQYFIRGTTDGTTLFDPELNLLNRFNEQSGLANSETGNSFTDHAGRLWLGTFNGISQLDLQEPIRIYDKRNGLKGFIEDIIEIDDVIYLATTNGIARLTPTGKIKYFSEVKQHVFKLGSFQNQLLAATTTGLMAMSLESYSVQPLNSIYGRDLIVINNKVFYATNEEGVLAYSFVNNQWHYDSLGQQIPVNLARYFFTDSNGALWFSNTSDKLVKVSNPHNDELDSKVFSAKDSVPPGDIRIREIGKQLFFISDAGVHQYQSNIFKRHVGFSDFLGDRAVIDLFQDKQDNTFIIFGSTANMQIRQITITPDSVWQLPSKINLITNTSTWAHLADDKGNLWLGGTKGLYLYNPGKDNSQTVNPILNVNIAYGEQKLPNQKESPTYAINIAYENSSIQFDYSILNQPHVQNEYRYRLLGLNREWSPWSIASAKDFSGLREGSYRFEIEGKTIDGVNTPTYKADFSILPPWYRSVPVLSLVSLVLLVFIVWVVRYFSTRQLVRKLEVMELQEKVRLERERISSDLHDNVGAQLTSLVSGLEMAESLEDNPRSRTKLIKSLRDEAKDSINSLRDTIWTLHKKEIALEDFSERIISYLQKYFQHTSINLSTSSSTTINSNLNPQVSLNIMRAIQEIAQNTLKHAKATAFSIQLKTVNGSLIITLEDDGVGFDINSLRKENQFGLRNIKDRIELSGGEYELKSEVNKGTCWQFTFDLAKYPKRGMVTNNNNPDI